MPLHINRILNKTDGLLKGTHCEDLLCCVMILDILIVYIMRSNKVRGQEVNSTCIVMYCITFQVIMGHK